MTSMAQLINGLWPSAAESEEESIEMKA